MTRRRIILGSLAAIFIAISGVVIAGTTLDQKGEFSHVLVVTSEDSDVIATIEGQEVTRGEVRKPADFQKALDPSISNDDAVKLVIVPIIDRFVIQGEVNRRGLVPTEKEAEDFMGPIREACDGPLAQECSQYIEQLGLTQDQYWEKAGPEYRKDLGKVNMFKAVVEEKGLQNADDEQIFNSTDAFQNELRDEATITWHDKDLERLYREALDSR